MTEQRPHPQRCETCSHLKKHEIHNLYCEISGRKTPHGTLFMERVFELGCASHSSRPAIQPTARELQTAFAKGIIEGQRIMRECPPAIQAEHDATIRNQTLKTILLPILEEIRRGCIHSTKSGDEYYNISKEWIDDKIESLRQQHGGEQR